MIAIGKNIGWPYERLAVGSWVKFRFSAKVGRIVDIIDEYPSQHARPYKVFLIRLDNGMFVTEQPEYLDPATQPKLKVVS